MGNVSNTEYPVLWQLKCNWSSHQPHRQHLFLNEWGGNFEFEFCNKIEDKFNRGMPYITHSAFLHDYLWRLQILLCIAPCVEVACKRLFLIQQHSKEQGQALVFDPSQDCFGLMFHL